MDIIGEEVARLLGGDFELHGLTWRNDGRDLEFAVVLPARGLATVSATWASGLRVALESDEHEGGVPLSWDASIQPAAGGRWRVRLDFAGRGEVEFECNELRLRQEREG